MRPRSPGCSGRAAGSRCGGTTSTRTTSPGTEDQQERLEASGTGYRRDYRDDPTRGLDEVFTSLEVRETRWTRTLDWPTYERWLRSTSYVAALPDQAGFLAAERASLARAFPDGRIVEPFRVHLVTARRG